MTINVVRNPLTDEPQNLGTSTAPWDSTHTDSVHTQYVRLHSFNEPLIGLPQGVIDLQDQYASDADGGPEGIPEWTNILHMRQSGLYVGSARVVMSAEVDVVNSKMDAFFGRNDYVHLGLSSHYPHLEDGWDSLVEIIARVKSLHSLASSIPALESRVTALEDSGVGGGGATALNGLTDVSIQSSSLVDGQLLSYSAGVWTNTTSAFALESHVHSEYASQSELASLQSQVASISVFSGSYNDLTNTPVLFSGSYNDLTDVPTLFDGSYSSLTGTPSLFSGDYADLVNKPTLFSGSYNDLSDTPTLFDGAYSSLSGAPTLFSGSYNDLTDTPTLFDGAYSSLSGVPTLFSGSYNDLTDTPTLFSGSYADLSNKPTLFSGSYNDLADKPTLFDGTYSSLTGVPALFSGSYNDLSDVPTLFDGAYSSLTGTPTIPPDFTADISAHSTRLTALESGTITGDTYISVSGTGPSYALTFNINQLNSIYSFANHNHDTVYATIASVQQADAEITALTATVAALPTNLSELDDTNITASSLTDGQYLKWDSSTSHWVPGNTSDIVSGVSSVNGLSNVVVLDTNDIDEGTTNLYYTDARVNSYLTNNSYATQSYVNSAFDTLVDAAPNALNTLNELAAALGDDPNFATTVTNSIASKLDANTTLSAGTGIATSGNLGSGASIALAALQTSPAGTYGTTVNIPKITVDAYGRVTAINVLAADFFSGSYTDLTNKPTLFSGSYTDLTNKPALFSGSYADLSDTPTLFSGSYNDLTDVPSDLVTTSVLSSNLSLKQNALTVGDGLSLETTGALSLTFSISSYLTSANAASTYATKTELSGKQDSLTEGQGISLAGATISTSFDIADYLTVTDASNTYATTSSLATKQDSFTVGSGLSLSNGTLSADVADLTGYATESYVTAQTADFITATSVSDNYATLSDISSFVTASSLSTNYSLKSELTSELNGLEVAGLADISIDKDNLSHGQYLKWDDTANAWVAGSAGDFTTGVSSLTAGNGISISNTTGAVTVSVDATVATTTALATKQDSFVVGQGLTLSGGTLSATGTDLTGYATESYVDSAIPNLSGYATESYVNTAVSNLVDSAPSTLDTLNELAAALGDDPNFATTVSNSIGENTTAIATKQDTLTAGSNIAIVGATISAVLTDYITSTQIAGTYQTLSDASSFESQTSSSLSSLGSRIGVIESDYLTASSSLSGGNVVGSISGQAGSVLSLQGHSITLADQTVSLNGGTLAATALSSALSASMSSELSISTLATDEDLSALESVVNSRQNITTIGSGLSLSNGTLSSTVDLSPYATAATLSNYVLTSVADSTYADSTTTASSITSLSGRISAVEADYLTTSSTLSSSKLSNSSISIAGTSVSLGSAITASSLSAALATDMAADLSLSSYATASTLSNYASAADLSTLTSTVNDLAGIKGISGDLSLSTAGTLSTSFNIADYVESSTLASDYTTSTDLTTLLTAKQDSISVSGELSLTNNALSIDLSSYATASTLSNYVTASSLSSNYSTTTDVNTALATKQDSLTAGSNITLSGNTISVDSSLSNAVSANTAKVGYTDTLARAAISSSGDITYDSSTGVMSYTSQWTTDSGKMTTENVVLVPGHIIEVFDMGADLTNQPDFTLDAGVLAGSVDRIVDCGILDQERLF